MRELPPQTAEGPRLPTGLTIEKPARNLAALAMTDSLAELRGVVLEQWRHATEFAELARYGIRPLDRMLFQGPPGNGKTMAAGWLAREIGAPLYRVRCESLVGAYLGETAARMGVIMAWLERHKGPAVVLFDEVETIFPARGLNRSDVARETNSAMGVFWQYLDRWETPTLFILATNMPDQLDPALVSRLELKIEFGPPTPAQAASVVAYWAEALHAFGGAEWGPLVAGRRWASFRELFQAVQMHVRRFVTRKV